MSAQPPAGPSLMDAIPLHRQPVDLLRLLSGPVEVLRDQAGALDVQVVLDAPSDLPRVRVDPDKVAWAVATLVGNALRHVRSGSRRLPGGTLRVRVQATADAIVISVEDDGPGIPPAKLDRLFERSGGGRHAVGLGLLMIRDVVVAHGGQLAVASRCDALDSGTTVTMRLPRERS